MHDSHQIEKINSLKLISNLLEGLAVEGKVIFHTHFHYEAMQLGTLLDSMGVPYKRVFDADITIYELVK